MLKFKLSLINFNNIKPYNDTEDINNTVFLNVMSEYYSQFSNLSLNTFCYTYDEKLSLHTNAQKELTFKLDQMILKENEWIQNPFMPYMLVGTQLLLEDQYNNQYCFTIKNIKYSFKAENIVLDINCQDTFSYQLSKQNNGYEIENDYQSEFFIGAHDIDFWINKICTECKIPYDYVPLSENYPDRPEYLEKISFSGSGSALSVLISLCEQLDMMIVTNEHINNNQLSRTFHLEPKKSEELSGIIYSPLTSIQNFELSHGGESLVTVLNVEGPTFNDEMVTLLPNIPQKFLTYFTSDEWENSSYYPNMFSTFLQDKYFLPTFDNSSTDAVLIINLPNLSTEDRQNMVISSNSHIDVRGIGYNYSNSWTWEEDGKISITGQWEGVTNIDPSSEIILEQKNITEDDRLFADAANVLPWLENRLIDFSYYHDRGVLNDSQYANLQDILNNKLRITNGKLLTYSKQYYNSLREKVNIISNIENQFETLAADCHAYIIDVTDATDIKIVDFQKSYRDIGWDSSPNNLLINRDEIIVDYFNKMFTMRQRMLKALYNFSQYWNADSNGIYWLDNHTDYTDTKAISIEVQLEEYWTDAYNASLYCDLFVPEHWQPDNNIWSNLFIDSDNKTLSSTFPKIQILTNQPFYSFNTTDSTSDTNSAVEQTINLINSNPIKYIINNNYPYSKTYYFLADNDSSKKHNNFINNMDVPNYSGLYIMEIQWLLNHYTEQDNDEYLNILATHNDIWKYIYDTYPGIVLENTFKNDNATNSRVLLELAQNAFKDLSHPERNYSLTVIKNLNEADGYYGQELKIGDAIQLQIDDFYNQYDDIYESLRQLLYISDISYSLRKNSDIQLTINTIKYQDKLIQRLVKLIR